MVTLYVDIITGCPPPLARAPRRLVRRRRADRRLSLLRRPSRVPHLGAAQDVQGNFVIELRGSRAMMFYVILVMSDFRPMLSLGCCFR